MEKGETIVLRVSGENKAAIKSAAANLRQSLTTFITEAALKRARQVVKRPPTRGVHGGVPSFFRACCIEAGQGGANGYASAGWHLANSIAGSQMPYDLEPEEWEKEIEALKELLVDDDDDDEGVWAWFTRHYPKCTELVPTRRRSQFVAGVRQANEDGRIEC